MSIIIKEVEKKDIPKVIELKWKISKESPFLTYSNMDARIDKKQIQKRKKHNTQYNVLISDGVFVGFIVMRELDSKVGYISLGLLKEYHGKGLGERLLRDMIETAVKIGHSSVVLYVPNKNHIAINLYNKIGFKFWSEITDFELGHMFLMCLKLERINEE